MLMLNTTSRWLVYFIGSMVFLSLYLSRRSNRRNYLTILRLISFPAAGAAFLFLIITALRSSQLLDSYFSHDLISSSKIVRLIFDWLIVLLFLYFFKICWLGFIKYDKIFLLSGWYINEHFSLIKQQKYDEACQYLQKAAELTPNSVFVWCFLANLNETIFKKPDQCDSYLSKAQQVVDSSSHLTPNEKGFVECTIGMILQSRGRRKEGLEHFKNAYDLDPTPFRKKVYEKALKTVQEGPIELD